MHKPSRILLNWFAFSAGVEPATSSTECSGNPKSFGEMVYVLISEPFTSQTNVVPFGPISSSPSSECTIIARSICSVRANTSAYKGPKDLTPTPNFFVRLQTSPTYEHKVWLQRINQRA